MENKENNILVESQDDMKTELVRIDCTDYTDYTGSAKPYFFLKYSLTDKRYRISTSFKYINIKYGLHINIIRDFKKIKPTLIGYPVDSTNAAIVLFIYELLNNHASKTVCCLTDTGIDKLEYTSFLDPTKKTQVFFITRKYNNELNTTVVFFSSVKWSLEDYLAQLKKGI